MTTTMTLATAGGVLQLAWDDAGGAPTIAGPAGAVSAFRDVLRTTPDQRGMMRALETIEPSEVAHVATVVGIPIIDDATMPLTNIEDEGFDALAEFAAMPAVDDGAALDGDFPGHPFRGNQYVAASSHSRSAVHASIKAKAAEGKGNARQRRAAHKTAYHAHMAAATGATGKARSYHRTMAKFHKGQAGVLDGVIGDGGDEEEPGEATEGKGKGPKGDPKGKKGEGESAAHEAGEGPAGEAGEEAAEKAGATEAQAEEAGKKAAGKDAPKKGKAPADDDGDGDPLKASGKGPLPDGKEDEAMDAAEVAAILDGDFPGHPFRGNQHVSGDEVSREASARSRMAKRSEGRRAAGSSKTSDDDVAGIHDFAASAHRDAEKRAKPGSKSAAYHKKMAEFHESRGRSKKRIVSARMDSAEPWPADIEEAVTLALDGDFPGHPFRGNQYVAAHRASKRANDASRRARRVNGKGSDKVQHRTHKAAADAHHEAAGRSTGRTAKFHKTMAKFHASRAKWHADRLGGKAMDAAGEAPEWPPAVAAAMDRAEPNMVNVFKSGDRVIGPDGADYVVTAQRGYQVSVKGRAQPIHANQLKLASGAKAERMALDGVDHGWHSRTIEKFRNYTDAQLRYVIKDATEAAELGEKMGNPKAGQYRDEVSYASMELKRRQKGGKQGDPFDPRKGPMEPNGLKAAAMDAVSELPGLRAALRTKGGSNFMERVVIMRDIMQARGTDDLVSIRGVTSPTAAAIEALTMARVSGQARNAYKAAQAIDSALGSIDFDGLSWSWDAVDDGMVPALDAADLFGEAGPGTLVCTVKVGTEVAAHVIVRGDGSAAVAPSQRAMTEATGYAAAMADLRDELGTWVDGEQDAADIADFIAGDPDGHDSSLASKVADTWGIGEESDQTMGNGRRAMLVKDALQDAGYRMNRDGAELDDEEAGVLKKVGVDYAGADAVGGMVFNLMKTNNNGERFDKQIKDDRSMSPQAMADNLIMELNAMGSEPGKADESFEHRGHEVVYTGRKDGRVWAVVDIDNPDSPVQMLFKTRDEATAYIDERLRINEANAKSRAEQDAKAAAAAEAERARRGDFDEWLATLKPMLRARANNALDKQVMRNGQPMELFRVVAELVREGAKPGAVNGKEALRTPGGAFIFQSAITKLGMDYARWLIVKAGGTIDQPAGRDRSKAQRLKDGEAALNSIQKFINRSQYTVMLRGMRGEEWTYFTEKAEEMARIIAGMPASYETDGQGGAAVAHLHYFRGGADWYITEKDKDGGVDQAFGLADLYGDGGELGYISITELVQNGVELDLHWKPKTIAQIRGDDADGGSEAQGGNPDDKAYAMMEWADEVVETLGGARTEPWKPSGGSGWRYATFSLNGVEVRLGVSSGGVVQVNGDPFTKDDRTMIDGRDALMRALRQAAPERDEAPAPTPMPAATGFRYALVNRPADIGTVPKGLQYTVEPRPAAGQPHHEMARHGILVSERKLSSGEIKSFELAPLVEGPLVEAVAEDVAMRMQDYAAQYVESAQENPGMFADKVIELTRAGGITYSIASPSVLADLVLGKLREMAADAPAVDSERVDALALLKQVAAGGHPEAAEGEFIDRVLAIFEKYAGDAEFDALQEPVSQEIAKATLASVEGM